MQAKMNMNTQEINFRVWEGEKFISLHEAMEQEFVATEGRSSLVNEFPKNMEIMLGTGLKDKNKKEIYESDIIRSNETDEVFLIGKILPLSRHLGFLAENIGYFDGNKYRLRSPGSEYHLDDWVSFPELYEIIGNKFENQSLLPSNKPKKE